MRRVADEMDPHVVELNPGIKIAFGVETLNRILSDIIVEVEDDKEVL